MALFSDVLSRVPRRRSAADILYEEIGRETPERGQEYLDRTTRATVSAGMPQFESRLQDIRENAIRRGVAGGDLLTSYEGDLASAFQRNIANVTGSRALDLYESSRNRYLDLLTGQRDYDIMRENAKKRGLLGLGIGPF